MATINKVYPHVNVTTKALIRTIPEIVDTGATSLFVPFYSKKGLSGKVQKIYNLNQFIAEYGEPDFAYQGRTVLDIYNWLSAGGSIYALRLVSPDATKATGSYLISDVPDPDTVISVSAKYEGEYYNDISLNLVKSKYSTSADLYLDAQILLNGVRVQSLYKLNVERFIDVVSSTEYIDVSISSGVDFDTLVNQIGLVGTTIELSGGDDGDFSFDNTLARFYGAAKLSLKTTSTSISQAATTASFTLDVTGINNSGLDVKWSVGDPVKVYSDANYVLGTVTLISETALEIAITSKSLATDPTVATWTVILQESFEYPTAESLISNKLENPIDVILDSGHSIFVKELIKDFSEVRDDIFYFLSDFDFSASETGSITNVIAEKLNQSVYAQKFSVEDVISGKNIWVGPSYFLASLIPFNDRVYGIQWPTAGLTRGVLSGVKSISVNPTSDDKDLYYTSRINYVEKDSRGYKFMSQLTGDSFIENSQGEYQETALKFINNARVTNRIIRDLEDLGRDYLFEFNDAATLLSMRNALNRYVTEWVQNRTLSLAAVEVAKDPFSDERVNVTLNIRFTGTIEVISIDLTIE